MVILSTVRVRQLPLPIHWEVPLQLWYNRSWGGKWGGHFKGCLRYGGEFNVDESGGNFGLRFNSEDCSLPIIS